MGHEPTCLHKAAQASDRWQVLVPRELGDEPGVLRRQRSDGTMLPLSGGGRPTTNR